MSKAYQLALKMIREGLVNALDDLTQGPIIKTAIEDRIAVNTADGISYENPLGLKLSGAVTAQQGLDVLASQALLQDQAADAVSVNALEPGDGVTIFGANGVVKYIEAALLFGATPQKVVTSAATSGNITTADVGNTIIVEASSNATRSLSLHSAQEMVVGSVVTFLHRGGGTFAVNCADSSIRVNELQGGSVSCSRGQKIICQNLAPDDWSVLVQGASGDTSPPTADTDPPAIESITPERYSTILAGTAIRVRFSEAVKPGTGLITQRQDSGAGFGNDGTFDVTAALGTDPGMINIIGQDLYIYPIAQVEGDTYAWRIAAGALTDLASPPNAFAGVADDATIGPFTIAESETAGIEVVNATAMTVSPGSVVGATQTRTMSATPSQNDMTIAFSACVATIDGGLPTGMTAVLDNTAQTNPGCFIARRVEGVTPSNQIAFRTASNRPQAAGALILRGSGLEISGSAFASDIAGASAANAPSYTPLTDGELVIAAHFIDTKDLTPTVTALTSAGFTVQINKNTEQGSTTAGATLVVATKADCPVGVAVDPPAIVTGNVVYRALTFGVKST